MPRAESDIRGAADGYFDLEAQATRLFTNRSFAGDNGERIELVDEHRRSLYLIGCLEEIEDDPERFGIVDGVIQLSHLPPMDGLNLHYLDDSGRSWSEMAWPWNIGDIVSG